jgi:hypothetical protein
MPRDIPLRERKQKKSVEDDPAKRAITEIQFSPPSDALSDFKDGYRECIQMYALHAPDKRGVGRTLDNHRILLEDACIRSHMARRDLARYEGFRQAMKDLRAQRRIR